MRSPARSFYTPAFLAYLVAAGLGVHSLTPAARAADCAAIIGLLQQGIPAGEIAHTTGVSMDEIFHCIESARQRQQVPAIGSTGHAVGPAPSGAAGPAPLGAAGPPPLGAAGPPPRAAAGLPPLGAAGPAPR